MDDQLPGGAVVPPPRFRSRSP